jgi:hypothetical protein
MARRALPFQVAISTPCAESWDAMTGTARQRHCQSCNKHVHDFATMTPREIERTILASGGQLCARLTHRPDGSLVHRESIVAPSQLAAAALSVTLVLSSAAHAQSEPTSQPTAQSPSTPQPALPTTNTAVSGVVTDSQGALVVGSSVTLLLNGAAIGSTITDEAGRFEFAVVPGEYRLKIAAAGFAPSSRSLSVGEETAEFGNIPLAPGGIQTTVTVTALMDSTTIGTMQAYLSYGPWYRRLAYHVRHPIAFAKHLLHIY